MRYNVRRWQASTGILSSELNDPLSIILSYVHGELFKPSDVNQVSNNLLKQRISVGKEPRNPSSSSSPRPAESDEQKSGPDIGGRRARVMTRRKKYGTLFIDKESEKKSLRKKSSVYKLIRLKYRDCTLLIGTYLKEMARQLG